MCVCIADFLQSTVADERVLITAASIWWGGEFVFVPSGAGGVCVCLLWVAYCLSGWSQCKKKNIDIWWTLQNIYNSCSFAFVSSGVGLSRNYMAGCLAHISQKQLDVTEELRRNKKKRI